MSSAKQKTIEEQTRICRATAAERGWDVRYQLSDHALQGDDFSRPAFQRLMDLAEQRAIDVVVCYRIDRLARSLAHAVFVEELLSEHGVAICSATEPGLETTTPVGRFLFGNLANAAQLEKAIIRERTRMGVHAQALKGKWIQSTVPFGYRRAKAGRLRIHPAEAEVVREVFATYARARSFAETAAVLNERGITCRGSTWSTQRVRLMLCNELYRGTYRMGDVVHDMPNLIIVPRDEFEEIRQLRRAAPRNGRHASASVRERAIENVFAQYFATLRDVPEEPVGPSGSS